MKNCSKIYNFSVKNPSEPIKNNGPCGSGKPSSPCCGNTNSCNGNNGNMRSNGGTAKRQCPASAHSDRKSRRSKENNMLLLLHQKDAENFGIQTGGGCGKASSLLRILGNVFKTICTISDNQSVGTKKTNICSGGNCGKIKNLC